MTILTGKGVCGGIAVGKAHFFRRTGGQVTRKSVSDPAAELARFEQARARAAKELEELYEKALREIGESGASIFEIHAMMLEDEDYRRFVQTTVQVEQVNAEYAVASAAEHFSSVFSAMNDPYMSARAADVKDISERICRILSGTDGSEPVSEARREENRWILCADDLSPSETMQLDREQILAFVTAEGSVNSHTAILARTMGIPAVVGIGSGLMALSEGVPLAVDGFGGCVYVCPDGETTASLEQKRQADLRAKELLQKYRGMKNETKDGTRIELFANIQSVAELGAARLNDAGGIGLFRSEFLYLDRNDLPDEEEQLHAYRTVLQSMGEKKVIIRTLDIGADKQAPCFGLEAEENPALGMRGIRVCLCRPAVLHTQLRALLRASAFGNLGIMFPMITSVSEVNEVLTLYRRAREELEEEGVPVSDRIELGIMIETPAAAVISDRLAPLVDFFSVGTNDLSQYTLAIDRQNQSVARFFNGRHEAILRLIETAAQNAHRYGKWIGICGELGADLSMTEAFLRMGIDELSVSPSCILPLREKIRGLDLREKP